MKIPNETELTEFIELTDTRLRMAVRKHEKDLLSRCNGRNLLPDDVKLFLKQYLCELEAVGRLARNASVMRWMTGQPGFERAAQLAQKGRQGRNEILVARRFEARLEQVEKDFLNHPRSSSATLHVSRLMHAFSFAAEDWPVCVLKNLAEYVHSDHDGYFIGKSKLVENCQRIEELVQEIRPYIDAERRATPVGSPKHVLMFVDRWKTLATGKKPRNQQNKAELRFVKGMVDLNVRFFGFPKPDAIAELMTLDCFRQPIGLRQISRVCAEHMRQKSP